MKSRFISKSTVAIALILLALSMLSFALIACDTIDSGESTDTSQLTDPSDSGAATDNTQSTDSSDNTVEGTDDITDITTEPKPAPVILGAQSEVAVYADDSAQDILAALTNGVYVDGHPEYKLELKVYNSTGECVNEFSEGSYRAEFSVSGTDILPVSTVLTVKAADTTPPEIKGATDLIVRIGDTVSYRKNITVSDNDDENVSLVIDSSSVDLTRTGTYSLTYSATDKRGNTAEVKVSVIVLEADAGEASPTEICTREELDALCDEILSEIFTEGMTDVEKLRAIYNRVRKITYIGTSDKSSWVGGAYTGLTVGKGDCYNYWAASKALITAAGFATYDLQRIGWTSQHFWQIVYVDGGWYHYDACPHYAQYPWDSFLMTESELRGYAETYPAMHYYYLYDIASCPYDIVD